MSRFRYRTPQTLLSWSTLAEWLHVAHQLEQRKSNSLNKERKRSHIQALPLDLVDECTDVTTLMACRGFLTLRRPSRGQRAHAPHTPLIVAIDNRISRLERPD